MNKLEQVCKVLLMPVYSNKSKDKILRKDNIIWTSKKHNGVFDADMSDFAIGFYEIVYKDILKNKCILSSNGSLTNKEFAGDTMNSFNTIANSVPVAGKSRKERTAKDNWPDYLRVYHDRYHCLANFWLLPMEIGRTITGKMNKAKRPINDYMDRFLEMVSSEISFNGDDRDYFNCFRSWDDFVCKHFLEDSYLKSNTICKYSQYSPEEFVKNALDKIEERAKNISKSEYAIQLYEYFSKHNLLE